MTLFLECRFCPCFKLIQWSGRSYTEYISCIFEATFYLALGSKRADVVYQMSSDVFLAADSQKVTLLALLDLSAVFDRLQSSFGLADKVLDWLRSFLTGRSQQVLRDGCLSELVMICLLYTSPSPRDRQKSRMPSSA